MRLSEKFMYDRVLASDADFNGRFFFGVLTTGIYCLPSCKARKPLRENIRFFPSCEAARAAGLRPCRKCHPDDFARGADPILESIETLVGEIRANPANFADARAIVRRSGFGTTRLFELFRQHYHTTPADLLMRARLALVRRQLVETDLPLATVAANAGFDSLSVFHEHFRHDTGLSPTAFRALPGSRSFTLALPDDYSADLLRRALARDPQSISERLAGDVFTAGIRLADGSPVKLQLFINVDSVEVSFEASQSSAAVVVHAIVCGMLGLDQDTGGFVRFARKLGFARLVKGREGLRIVQKPSVFDGLLWAIIGQQINLPFARLLRRRLTELAGTPLDENLFALPTPADIARLSSEQLLPLQFSRQKASYLIELSRRIVEGALDLRSLSARSATHAERSLLAIRGLGPWSVNYVMMRSLGFADCVPYGDTGLTSGLHTLFALETRPDVQATRQLMNVFSPYRSLATAHLWQLAHTPSP